MARSCSETVDFNANRVAHGGPRQCMVPTCRRIIRSRCCLLIPWAAVRVQDSSLGASWPAEPLNSTPARYGNV